MKTKDCPFCEAPDPTVEISGGNDERTGYNFTAAIACLRCGAQMIEYSRCGPNGWCEEGHEVAIERVTTRWNTRVETAEVSQVWGFYEEEYPIYTQGPSGANELSSLMTAEEANGLVAKLKAATEETDRLKWLVAQAALWKVEGGTTLGQLKEALGPILDGAMRHNNQLTIKPPSKSLPEGSSLIPGARWKHKKGGTYLVIGKGLTQVTLGLSDLEEVIIYQSEKDDSFWVRPTTEFTDGRFAFIGHEPSLSPADKIAQAARVLLDSGNGEPTVDVVKAWERAWNAAHRSNESTWQKIKATLVALAEREE